MCCTTIDLSDSKKKKKNYIVIIGRCVCVGQGTYVWFGRVFRV